MLNPWLLAHRSHALNSRCTHTPVCRSQIGNVAHFNDTRFRLAASHLSPAVVRVGGITADWVRYTGFADAETRPPPSSTSEPAAATSAGTDHKGHGLRRGLWGRHPGGHSNTLGGYWPTEERNLTLDVFTQLYDFMAAANLSLMLDLNELHGRNCHTLKPGCSASNAGCWFWCTGPWDTSNVRQLLQYLHDRGLVGAGSPLYAFELGNELVSHMTAQQTTADIVELAGIIQSIWSDHPAPKRPGLYVGMPPYYAHLCCCRCYCSCCCFFFCLTCLLVNIRKIGRHGDHTHYHL